MKKRFFTFLCSTLLIATSTIQTMQQSSNLYNLNAPKLFFGIIGISLVGLYLGRHHTRGVYEDIDDTFKIPLGRTKETNTIGLQFIAQYDVMIGDIEKEVSLFEQMRLTFNAREKKKQLCPCCPNTYANVTSVFQNNLAARKLELEDLCKRACKDIRKIENVYSKNQEL
jgi:hypothetical protein